MLWYKDLISPHEYTIFYFDEYANEDMQEAEKFFKKAVKLDPNFANAYYHLALIRYELNDYNSKIESIHNSIQLADAKPGKYMLIIRIMDMNSGKTVEKNVTFEISE